MPDRFDDLYDYDDEEEEPYQSTRRWLQPVILIIALTLVIAMAGVPVVNILTLMDNSDSEESVAERARRNTALLFAESVLQQRSTSRAEAFIDHGLRDRVDAIVGDLQSREPATLADTSVTVRFARCSRVQLNGDECFEATLAREGEPPVMAIQYAVEIVNNAAIVSAVNRAGRII